MNPITISIDGVEYSGWTRAKASRSLKGMAGTFSMAIAFEGADLINQVSGTSKIKKGSKCTIMIAGQLFLTGEVEKRQSSGSKDKYTLNIEGRSKTKRLVNSEPAGKDIQFNNMKRKDIVNKIASELGVNVIDKSGSSGSKVYRYILADGVSAGQEIYNILRESGLQVCDDPQGNLVIINPDGDGNGDDLVLGVNIEEWNADLSKANEAKTYKAVGHSVPTDNNYGKSAVEIAAKAIDNTFESPEIRRIRVKTDVDLATLKDRATLEARRSESDGNTVTIKTKHITQSSGELWKVNQKHRVSIWVDDIDIVLLMKSVSWEFSKNECTVTLELTMDRGHSAKSGKGAKNNSKGVGSATGPEWESSELNTETES